MTGDQLNTNGFELHSIDLNIDFSGKMNGGSLLDRKPCHCDFSARLRWESIFIIKTAICSATTTKRHHETFIEYCERSNIK